MNKLDPVENDDVVTLAAKIVDEALEIPLCDERYPGSFFTIPAPIVLGKTTWSLS
jgi:hypothetical protein